MGILRRGGASSLRASHTIIVIFICILAFSLPACNRDVYDNLFDPVNQYTVTFDSQGGTAVSAQTVDYGTTISQPPDPVLTGFTFAGWFAEPGCTTPWLFGSGKVEGDTTLYARWTINQYTVAFDPQGGSAIAPQTVSHNGTAADPGAPARTGYTFGGWFQEAGCVTQWVFAIDTVTENRTLYAQWTINTYTLAYTAGANGSLTGSTTQFVTHGANGTAVTAVPNVGYHFTSWSDGSTDNPRTDTGVTGNITVTANFAINQYTLSYSAGANGSLSGASAQVVNHGSDGTAVTVVPNVGYHFTSWSDGSTDNPRTDTNVTGTITVSANFAINQYTLTYTSGANGTIAGTTPQTVNHGASGSAVTATPNVGYHFTSWSDGVLTATRTDTNVTGAITVTASFAINTYTLTYNAGAGGSITGSSPQTVNHGSNGTAVTATPNVGYHFTSWSDGGLIATRTDTNVTGDMTVIANFAINTYTLTYTAGANGSISGTSPQTVNHGSDGTAVTATPNLGYHFVDWSDGSTTNPRTDTNVTGAIIVSANFAVGGTLAASTFSVDSGSPCWDVAVNPGANTVYASCGNRLHLLNAATGATIGIFATYNGVGVAVNLNTGLVYVVNSSISAGVTFFNSDGTYRFGTLAASNFPTGLFPHHPAVNPTTGILHVTNYNSNTVTYLDAATGGLIGNYPTGANPWGVAVNSTTNIVYVTSDSSSSKRYLDASSGALLGDYAIGSNSCMVAVNPAANIVYFTNTTANTVTYLNATTGALIGHFTTGSNPHGVAVNPAANILYVINDFSDTMTYFNATTGAYLFGTLANSSVSTGAGSGPIGVAVNPSTNTVYVITYNTRTVIFFDATTGEYKF